MAIKYKYKYKEYKEFPTATDISKSRERRKPLFHFTAIAFSIIVVPIFVANLFTLKLLAALAYFPFAALCVFDVVYSFLYYDKHTEHKIKKEIERVIKEREEMNTYIRESKYVCKYIERNPKISQGKCMVCFGSFDFLQECKIKNDIGTRTIFVCNECINKFEENCTKYFET